MLLCPSSFCFRIFFSTYQTYQTDWQRPFDPRTKTPTDSSIVYTWNWTCMTTDMTWNVSMPNCTDIKWYAFVLHIHARFYGVKLSSQTYQEKDKDWPGVQLEVYRPRAEEVAVEPAKLSGNLKPWYTSAMSDKSQTAQHRFWLFLCPCLHQIVVSNIDVSENPSCCVFFPY